MDFFKYLKEWINENPGKALGGFAGFVLGMLFLTLGILKTLLIVLFVVIGIIIGKMKDDNVSILDNLPGMNKRKKYKDLDDEDL